MLGAFRDLPVTRAAIGGLDPFNSDPTLLDSLLDAKVLLRRYAVTCPSCYTGQIAFNSKRKAESTLRSSGDRCLNCLQGRLAVSEVLQVEPLSAAALQQGLWLESLASDTVGELSPLVWTGQMIENIEIDVLCVFAGMTILIECKDTNFGQNDLYVAAAKAEQVGANLVVIISTQPFHQNVVDGVMKIGKDSSRRDFRTITCSNASEIGNELRTLLLGRSEHHVRDWLSDDGSLYDFSFSDMYKVLVK
jgi:hypothetical protein